MIVFKGCRSLISQEKVWLKGFYPRVMCNVFFSPLYSLKTWHYSVLLIKIIFYVNIS